MQMLVFIDNRLPPTSPACDLSMLQNKSFVIKKQHSYLIIGLVGIYYLRHTRILRAATCVVCKPLDSVKSSRNKFNKELSSWDLVRPAEGVESDLSDVIKTSSSIFLISDICVSCCTGSPLTFCKQIWILWWLVMKTRLKLISLGGFIGNGVGLITAIFHCLYYILVHIWILFYLLTYLLTMYK